MQERVVLKMKVLINTREVINTPANIINGAQAARLFSCKKDLGFTTSRSLLIGF